jgi:hypothetical protein
MSSDDEDSFTWCNESPRRMREAATPNDRKRKKPPQEKKSKKAAN